MQMMTTNRFRHMPVVRPGAWEDSKVVRDELLGMLSIGDCVFDVVNELGEHVSALGQQSWGCLGRRRGRTVPQHRRFHAWAQDRER